MGLEKTFLILQEALLDTPYKVSFFDTWSHRVIEVTDGDTSCFLNWDTLGMYPTNARFASGLSTDKWWTKQLLAREGFETLPGTAIFLQPERVVKYEHPTLIAEGITYAKKLGFPVFIKPISGAQGEHTYVIYNEHQLKQQLRELQKLGLHAVILEPYMQAPDYRMMIMGEKVYCCFERVPASLTGDGEHTIAELLQLYRHRVSPKQGMLDQIFIDQVLREKNYELSSVLSEGQHIPIRANSNLSVGGTVQNLTTVVSDEVKRWAKKMSQVTALHTLAVDFFAPEGIDSPETFVVIEVNHKPGFEKLYDHGYHGVVHQFLRDAMVNYFAS